MPGETEMTTTGGGKKKPMEDIEAQVDDGEDEETKKKREFERTLWTRIWHGTAGAAIVFNILSFSFYFGGATLVAGLVGIAVSAVVIKVQFELQDTDSLRQVQNELRHQVNDFAEENTKLTSSNDRLENQLAPLKETEQKLSAIAEKQGSDVNRLTSLVKDNAKITAEMKKLVEADVVYQMIEAVLDSEKSEDGEFSDAEIRRLALRLDGLPAIHVDRNKLTDKLKDHRNVHSVVNLMRTINDDDIPEDDRIFTIAEDYDPEEDV